MSDQRAAATGLRGGLAAMTLLGTLGLALALGTPAGLQLATPSRTAVTQLRSVIGGIPAGGMVLVVFDPDIGTYPEIRFAVRSLLDDLLARGLGLGIVSYTPEGRALALAELDRLVADGASASRLLDLGFRTGAEAALVSSVSSVLPDSASGPLANALRSRGGGLRAFDLALIVAGVDLGPRTWVEQVRPRVPGLALAAVVPTSLRAELEPYLASGQLAALLGTLRDDAAYASGVPTGSGNRAPTALAILLGMLAALAVMLQASSRGIRARLRRAVIGRERW